MKNLDQLIEKWKQENVSRWIGSWIERIGDYIKKTYSPREVAIMILLSVSLIYVFSQIVKEYLEKRSMKKKVNQISQNPEDYFDIQLNQIIEDYFERRSIKKKILQIFIDIFQIIFKILAEYFERSRKRKVREKNLEESTPLHQEFQIWAEKDWRDNLDETQTYLIWLSNDLLDKLEANSPNSYTFLDVKNILFLIELLVGFRMDDSFEYELKHLQQVFRVKNWNYRRFLHCRHIHNVVQKELLENINPQLELDSTVEFENEHLYLLVQIMLESPPLWGDP